MSKETRIQADARLDEAARQLRYADPRPPLRDRLRELKDSHPAAFERARHHFEQEVVPALADASDPLAAWVDYARFLAGLTAAGRMLAVNAEGEARPYANPAAALLVLHVPDDTALPVLVALVPEEPSPAQRATLDLLVHRKLSL